MIGSLKPVPFALSVFLSSLIFLITGCGSGGTQARLMNAMNGQSSVNLLVNNATVASGVSYGTASAYATASSGSQQIQIQSGGVTLLNVTASVNGGKHNTILATDSGLTVLQDNNTTPSMGNIQIRLINASVSLGTADAYVVAPGTDLTTVSPDATLNFQAASQYITKPAGTYVIQFTQTGVKQATIPGNPTSFSSQQIRTVVSLDGNGIPSEAVLSDLN